MDIPASPPIDGATVAAHEVVLVGHLAGLPTYRACVERLYEFTAVSQRDAESVTRIASRAEATE